MTTYVLVHGAWGGGWKFARVAERLRKRGHIVFTPTLTGQGERSHLSSGAINLTTHVTDILNVIRYEDLSDVVLLGHSYGGMVITAVADTMPEKIAALVYLDAFIPEDGQVAVRSQHPGQHADVHRSRRCAWRPVRAAAAGGLISASTRRMRARVDALAAPHPIATMIEKIRLTGAYRDVKKHVYVHGAVLPRESPFKPILRAAKARRLGSACAALRARHHARSAGRADGNSRQARGR